MSINLLVNNAVNDLKQTLNNNDIMYKIVQDLVGKLNNTNIVTPENKNSIVRYMQNFPLSGNSMNLNVVELKNIETSSPKDLLLLTIIYYLSDLNKYDYHLINFGFDYGLTVEDIIILLLLNDIYTIDTFCYSRQIFGSQYYTLVTLKKLSAMHKVEFNF
jgi:hypothetical protein